MINKAYLKEETLKTIKQNFDAQDLPNIKLGKILDNPQEVRESIESAESELQRDPLSYNYTTKKIPLTLQMSVESALHPLFELLGNVKDVKTTAYEISHKSYTMILKTDEDKQTTDFYLDVTEEFPENAGGAFVYANDKDTIVVDSEPNTLFIVKKEIDTQSFLQYANHYATKRLVIKCEMTYHD